MRFLSIILSVLLLAGAADAHNGVTTFRVGTGHYSAGYGFSAGYSVGLATYGVPAVALPAYGYQTFSAPPCYDPQVATYAAPAVSYQYTAPAVTVPTYAAPTYSYVAPLASYSYRVAAPIYDAGVSVVRIFRADNHHHHGHRDNVNVNVNARGGFGFGPVRRDNVNVNVNNGRRDNVSVNVNNGRANNANVSIRRGIFGGTTVRVR